LKAQFFLLPLLIYFYSLADAQTRGSTATYKIEWEWEDLPIKVRTLVAGAGVGENRISETGIVKPGIKLPSIAELGPSYPLRLAQNDVAYLYIFVENTSTKSIKFAVSPHAISPAHSSLGFDFTCLCNGHVYQVGPKQTWYRIMKLNTRKHATKEPTTLKHVIFKVD
jgi:hypothetical protein